jgi:hypothetical protein
MLHQKFSYIIKKLYKKAFLLQIGKNYLIGEENAELFQNFLEFAEKFFKVSQKKFKSSKCCNNSQTSQDIRSQKWHNCNYRSQF